MNMSLKVLVFATSFNIFSKCKTKQCLVQLVVQLVLQRRNKTSR